MCIRDSVQRALRALHAGAGDHPARGDRLRPQVLDLQAERDPPQPVEHQGGARRERRGRDHEHGVAVPEGLHGQGRGARAEGQVVGGPTRGVGVVADVQRRACLLYTSRCV